jgi:hypothetical protein
MQPIRLSDIRENASLKVGVRLCASTVRLGMKDVSAASELLKPFDARLMRCYPVSTRINHVANDDEECSAPVEVAETQVRLF